MSGDPEGADVEAEGASHPIKRMKTENEKDDHVIPSIETAGQSISSENPEDINHRVVELSNTIADASTSAAALVAPESGAVHCPSSVSKASGWTSAVAASEPSTRRSSFSASSIPAISNNGNISVDFTEAPSEPVELAIWVAQQIQRFCTDEAASLLTTTEADEARRRSLSHMPGVKAREKADRGLDDEQVEQRNRSRDAASSRKRSWRETQKELSKSNSYRRSV